MNRLAHFASVGSLGIATATAGQTVTYESTGHNIHIPAGGGIVTLDFVLNDPLVLLDVDVGLNITHTWQGSVSATIEHVGFGGPVTIINRPGGTGFAVGFSTDNFGNLTTGQYFILDDEASNVYDTPFVPAPGLSNVIGHWKPDGPPTEGISSLSAFDGQSISGTWRLLVSSFLFSDVGSVRALQLTFTIPGPMSIGPLIVGVVLWRRQRRRDD